MSKIDKTETERFFDLLKKCFSVTVEYDYIVTKENSPYAWNFFMRLRNIRRPIDMNWYYERNGA